MNHNLVLGAALGYQADQIRPFARSLRKHYDGQIALLVNSRDPALAALMDEHRITPVFVAENIETHWICVQRFRLYHDYLSRTPCEEVLLCDTRDILFQADPFSIKPNTSLAFCSEPELIGNCDTNFRWYVDLLGERELDKVRSKYILCGGTIYGQRLSMLNFIAIFWSEMNKLFARGKAHGFCDQALINYLAYNVIEEWTRFDTMNSPVATLHHTKVLTFNRDGRLVNRDGSVIPVVHQYDRIKPLVGHFMELALA